MTPRTPSAPYTPTDDKSKHVELTGDEHTLRAGGQPGGGSLVVLRAQLRGGNRVPAPRRHEQHGDDTHEHRGDDQSGLSETHCSTSDRQLHHVVRDDREREHHADAEGNDGPSFEPDV